MLRSRASRTSRSFQPEASWIPPALNILFFVLHSHYLVDFPVEAFTGIYEPWPCEWSYQPVGKYVHREPLSTPNLKMFQSKKSHCIYLYMLNGEGENRYEVTWIVQDGKYLTRVVDGGI